NLRRCFSHFASSLHQPPFYDRNVNIMYNKIVNAPLVFPVTVTNFYLRDLISKLLIREPSQRLGAGPTDAAEIMRHEFFRGMDWDRLYAREVPPPFVPSSKGIEDVSNFDKSFTGLHISDPLEPPSSAAPADSHHATSANVYACRCNEAPPTPFETSQKSFPLPASVSLPFDLQHLPMCTLAGAMKPTNAFLSRLKSLFLSLHPSLSRFDLQHLPMCTLAGAMKSTNAF
ncbi:unnamed protein product, partial [Closterium sp. NIES-65]